MNELPLYGPFENDGVTVEERARARGWDSEEAQIRMAAKPAANIERLRGSDGDANLPRRASIISNHGKGAAAPGKERGHPRIGRGRMQALMQSTMEERVKTGRGLASGSWRRASGDDARIVDTGAVERGNEAFSGQFAMGSACTAGRGTLSGGAQSVHHALLCEAVHRALHLRGRDEGLARGRVCNGGLQRRVHGATRGGRLREEPPDWHREERLDGSRRQVRGIWRASRCTTFLTHDRGHRCARVHRWRLRRRQRESRCGDVRSDGGRRSGGRADIHDLGCRHDARRRRRVRSRVRWWGGASEHPDGRRALGRGQHWRWVRGGRDTIQTRRFFVNSGGRECFVGCTMGRRRRNRNWLRCSCGRCRRRR